jgi:parallel beta-helix repeat protein
MGANTVIEGAAGQVIVVSGAFTQNVLNVNGQTGAVSLTAASVGAPSLAQLAAVGAGNGALLVGFEHFGAGAV